MLDLDTEHQQLVITLSDKIAELNGAAMKDGKPISEAYVIVAPSTRKLIRNWPESILVRAAADGKFCLRGISPESYRVIALSPAEWDKGQLPGMLAAQIAVATEVDIADGETKSILIE